MASERKRTWKRLLMILVAGLGAAFIMVLYSVNKASRDREERNAEFWRAMDRR